MLAMVASRFRVGTFVVLPFPDFLFGNSIGCMVFLLAGSYCKPHEHRKAPRLIIYKYHKYYK